MLSIYIHIPFCLKKCPYCNFNSYAFDSIKIPDLEKKYTETVINEFNIRINALNLQNETVATIYFGGGTPSIFSAHSLGQIITAIKTKLNFASDIEITLEANPATITTLQQLAALKSIGLTRISLGVQSFLNDKLKFLGRLHSVQDARVAFELLRTSGFSNLNLDLIFGYASEKVEDLEYELRELLALMPEHVSIYGLSIEKGSAFFAQAQANRIFTCSEETYAELYRTIQIFLAETFCQYEISNFAQPNYESRHNLNYWNGENYLGLGAGAHSYLSVPAQHSATVGATSPDHPTTTTPKFARRFANVSLPSKYMAQFSQISEFFSSTNLAFEETLTLEQQQMEFTFLSLRKASGLNLQKYQKLFGKKSFENLQQKVRPLIDQAYLALSNDHLQIPPQRFIIADSIVEKLVA